MGPKKHTLKGQPRRAVPSAALTSTAPTSDMPLPFKLDLQGDVVESMARLMPYQREGIDFGLARSARLLLADEMGLGKPPQSIVLAAHYAAEWPLLIVCPASMRYVWAAELESWLPTGLAPALVHLCAKHANIPYNIIPDHIMSYPILPYQIT